MLSILKVSLAQDELHESTFETDSTQTTTDSTLYPCELIKPHCSCLGSINYILCEQFDSFEQLDFTPLGYPDNRTRFIETLELCPRVGLVLNDSLRISNIAIEKLFLCNITGIDLFSNPFKNAIWSNRAELYWEYSNIQTFQPSCNASLLPDG